MRVSFQALKPVITNTSGCKVTIRYGHFEAYIFDFCIIGLDGSEIKMNKEVQQYYCNDDENVRKAIELIKKWTQ
ncbi:hypothetical protein AZF04_18805 [Alkalihalobacillus trypoxylicola]|uniref:Uncharacterized protein n=1 Tax=Alkalihalobacillus trypoxylicola TaxID=519424 RepID=A0A162DSQ9_9BACI|nr:hypothetical protein AZF04_18805 [Alkalihalobacillus trypoxylicola]